jgi:hypothetical protein
MPLSRVPSSFTGTTSIASPSANTIRFTTASTTRGQFDDQGNFSVGSFTVPRNTVVKTWSNSDFTRVNQSGSYNLNLYYSTSNNRWEYAGTGHGATFVDSGSGNFSIQSTSASGNVSESAASTLTQRIVFASNGSVSLPSGQLQFPSTQNASSDANTLDDYEEGTWTVNPVRWTWTGSKTGSYIKIGRLVHLNYVVDATSISYTGAGSGWAIDGWPFTIDSVAIASLGECTAFTTNIFLDNIGNQLFGRTSTNTASGIGSGGNFNASGRIKFTLTYYTSS